MAPILFTTPPLPTAHSFSVTWGLPHGLVCFLSVAPEEPQWAPGPLLLAWRKVHDTSGACYQASHGSWGGTYTQEQHSKHSTTGILVHCPIRMDATYKKQVQPHCWMPPCTPQPPGTPYPGSSGKGGFQEFPATELINSLQGCSWSVHPHITSTDDSQASITELVAEILLD